MKGGPAGSGYLGKLLTCWGISQLYPAMKMLFAESVYEDLDHLVSQKEDLLVSPGGCPACPPGTSGCHHPLAVHVFSVSADLTYTPGSQRQLSIVAGWPLRAP